MKETPILFKTEMVKAALDGNKSNTRRTKGLEKINEDPNVWHKPFFDNVTRHWNFWQVNTGDVLSVKCPYGGAGDLLWVRETWRIEKENPVRDLNTMAIIDYDKPTIQYKADKLPHIQEILKPYWKPAIFMFKKDARLWLEIISVRPERLQEITEEDAIAEGVERLGDQYVEYFRKEPYTTYSARIAFESLWDSINAKKHPWESNPWVWRIEFKRVD